MRGRLLHTINSLALSVTCGDTLPLLSLRDGRLLHTINSLAKEKSICSKNS